MTGKDVPLSGAAPDSAAPSRSSRDIAQLVGITLLCLIFLRICYVPLWHTDTWGHLAFGREIVNTKSLPDREPFSPFADKDKPYVHFQWLTQLGGYLLFRSGASMAGGDDAEQLRGGAEMLRIAYAMIVTLRFALLFLAFQRLSGSAAFACGGLAAAFLLDPFLAFARPRAVGQLFFAALLLCVSAPVMSRLSVAAVTFVMVAWANFHGSFVVGLALLGLLVLGRFLETWRSEGVSTVKSGFKDVQLRRLLAALLLSVAAVALLNPNGPRLYWLVIKLSGNANVKTFTEWKPLRPALGWGAFLAYSGAVVLVAVSWLHAREEADWKPTKRQLVLLLFFATLPWISRRFVVWWLAVAPWLALSALANARASGSIARAGGRRRWKLCLAIVIVLAAACFSTPVRWLLAGKPPMPLDSTVTEHLPWRLAIQLEREQADQTAPLPDLQRALRAHYPNGKFQGGIFPSETQGDYLIWALAPEVPIFVYTHVHLFKEKHWQKALVVKFGQTGWERILKTHGINLVVVEIRTHPHLVRQLRQSKEWLLFEREVSDRKLGNVLIALRKDPIPSPHDKSNEAGR